MHDYPQQTDSLKISVAMTTHNGAKFLEKQLRSILDQTRKPNEIIVCDDASSDQTVDLLEQYARAGHLQYHVNTAPIGVNANFKKAVSLCSPDHYVSLADQDDIWQPGKLEKSIQLLRSIEKKELPCFIYSDLELIDEKDQPLHTTVQQSLGHHKYKHCFETLLYGNFVLGCTVLMNPRMRDFLNDLPDTASFHHDAWIALTGFALGCTAQLPGPEVLYRSHTQNVTFRKTTKKSLTKKIQTHFLQLLRGSVHMRNQFDLLQAFSVAYQHVIPQQKAAVIQHFLALKDKNYLKQKIAFESSFRKQWTGRFKKA